MSIVSGTPPGGRRRGRGRWIVGQRIEVEVERRYADYLSPDGPPGDSDPEPGREGPAPERAWLQRADAPTLTNDWVYDGRPIPWVMTLEHDGGSSGHEGPFAELAALARRAGVEDFRVWDPDLYDFRALGPDDVRPLGDNGSPPDGPGQ